MSEATGAMAQAAETDTELELSADELRALSGSVAADERETSPTALPAQPATSASPRQPDAPKASTSRASHLTIAVVAAAGVVGAYTLASSERSSQPIANTSPPTSASELTPRPAAAEHMAQGEPVRFANPFDTAEVFEFPPGTSDTEARDAVAAVLTERALSRQKT